jgi:hypothetical protein
MGLFNKLFGKKNSEPSIQPTAKKEPEHAVIIRFNYGIEGLEVLHNLEDKLEKKIAENKAGEYDGHEIATDYSDGILYMYGPDAENLFKIIKPILDETDFMKGAIAKLRFGPPDDGVKEIEVEL